MFFRGLEGIWRTLLVGICAYRRRGRGGDLRCRLRRAENYCPGHAREGWQHQRCPAVNGYMRLWLRYSKLFGLARDRSFSQSPPRRRRISEPDQKELAASRTDLAEDRTLLAHERSFAGWIRTGMAAVGIGLGFNALFDALKPAWIPKAIATAFLLIAIFIFVSSERRTR